MEVAPLPSQITFLPNTDLYVPDWNPRKIVEQGPLQLLTDYILKGGRLDRLLLWKGEGKAPYAVISGQRRLLAYRRAGVERVEVDILDITLEEAKIMANTSNQGEPVYWLDKFENWETLLADYSNWGGITALASKLGKDRAEVSRAVNLIGLLTPKARKMIREHVLQNPTENKGNNATRENFTNSDGGDAPAKEPWRLNESAANRLNGLWKGRSLSDAQALAERAIPQMLSKQMTASQVDQWVQKANGGPKALPLPKGEKGGGTNLPPLTEGEKKGVLGSKAETPQAPPKPKPAPAPPTSHGRALLAEVGSFLVANFKRALGTLARRWLVQGLVVILAVLLFSPHLPVSLYRLVAGHRQAVGTPAPQAAIPVSSAPTAASQVPVNPAPGQAQAPKPTATKVSANIEIPAKWKDRVAGDRHLVDQFVSYWYGTRYDDMSQDTDAIASFLDPDYWTTFIPAYFPVSKANQIKKLKLAEVIIFDLPFKVLAVDRTSTTFSVQGPAYFSSYLYKPDQKVSQGPVALEVRVRHNPGDGDTGKVVWVKVFKDLPVPDTIPAPSSVQNQGSGQDLGKQIGQGINDASDAVNKAGQANTALDKVKKLNPF